MKKNKVSVDKTLLMWALSKVVVVTRTNPSHLELYNSIKLETREGFLVCHGSNGSSSLAVKAIADGEMEDVLIPSSVVNVIGSMRGDCITFERDGNRVLITDGIDRSSSVGIFAGAEVQVGGKTISYSPADYFTSTAGHSENGGTITAAAWSRIVKVAAAMPVWSKDSWGFALRSNDGTLRMTMHNSLAAVMFDATDCPTTGRFAVHIPVGVADVIPSGGTMKFSTSQGRVTFSDPGDTWVFSSPTIAVDIPELGGYFAFGNEAELLAETPELQRCAKIANNFVVTVGEGKGTVSAGRVRLTSTQGKVRFRTAGEVGDYDGGDIIATPTGEFDVTLAAAVLTGPLSCFQNVRMGISSTHVYLEESVFNGLKFVLMPLKAVWSD